MIRSITPIIAAGLLAALVPTRAAGVPKSPVGAARSCRKAIAHSLAELARLGLRELDHCERRKAAGHGDLDCTKLRSGATRNTPYRLWQHRTERIIQARCPLDTTARASFPGRRLPAGDIAGDPILVIPGIASTIEASASELQAIAETAGPVTASALDGRCLVGIASARTLIAFETMRSALQCQAIRDHGTTTTGPLAPDCQVPPRDAVVRRGAGRIAGACADADSLDAGACGPLPRCALDSAVETGLELARIAVGECGNGAVDTAEECDDGNDDPSDDCNQCIAPVCGNGIHEGHEECDDGNQIGGDGCSADCRLAVCGDGVVEGSEECDDHNDVPHDGCTECRADPVACSSAGILATVTFDYDPIQFTEIAGMRLRLRYDPAALAIPGSLVGPTINQRVKNLTGLTSGASFSVADRDLLPAEDQPDGIDDTLQTIIAVTPGHVPPGLFEQARFDCLGPDARVSQLECIVDTVVDPFTNKIDDDQTNANTRCTITLETAPEQ